LDVPAFARRPAHVFVLESAYSRGVDSVSFLRDLALVDGIKKLSKNIFSPK
jgi:hypothetical protein